MEEEDKEEAHTDRQPRQHHKVQQAEQQAPQKKRRAEISSPERPMSISPSPRRSPPRRTTKRSPRLKTPNQSQDWQDYAQKETSKTRYKPTFHSSRKAS
jgi:hypothetical protein